ncbi:hypothetical protein [Lactobacillus delbrueckii]|uniref:hypothetical protein n=1 Tax=Lactobacillus delbrueckii TaxID=1584 RepID=UPI001E59779A|nr:hypothetical protein [Lactobacillus delbrueckii]MCD5488373.1 hypothetical protein [Lactobacillus delbrueckii subsp. lactis]
MAESKSASVVFTNGSLLAKNAQAAAGSAKSAADNAYNLAYSAQKTADGKNSIYRGSNPNTVPTANLKVGDLYFSDNAAYVWNGSSWEEAVSDTTGAEIHEKVDKAMAEKDKAIADMKADIQADVAKINEEIEQTNIKTGNALNFYKEQYYLSNSYTELAGGSWSDEVPTKTEGKYIWSRYVTANVGDPTNRQYSDPVCISGLDGPQGPSGADVYYSKYEMSPNQQTMYLSDLTPTVSATNLPKLGSHVIAPSGKVYEVTATYPNANPPQYGVGPQLTSLKGPQGLQGLQGPKGDQGVQGPKGPQGESSYTHIAYSNSSDGRSDFDVSNGTNKTYIGIYVDSTPTDSTDPTKYTWTLIKGADGAQGVPGPKGVDGRTPYFHVAYANSSDGAIGFDVSNSDGKLYIGQYTDYTQADSTNPASYAWTKIKGDTGATGPQGPKGEPGQTGFFIGATPPPNPAKGTVWATNDSSGNMASAKTWNGSAWVSTAFTQDLVAGNITATKIQGGELDINKITVKNAQNIPITSTVSLGQKLSNIEQDADGVKTTVIGGGNLLNNTSDTLQSFTVTEWAWYVISDDEPIAKHQLDGKTVTLSAWIENPSKEAWVQMWTDKGRFLGNKIPTGGKGWSQVTYTMPSGFTTWNIVVGCGDGSGTITLSYSSLQLELGPNRTAWKQSTADISQLKLTSDGLNAYVKGSRGSKTLESILSMDPDHSSIAQVVNGQIAAAISTHSDGSVRIDGKALYINSHAKIDDATIKSAMIDSIEADKIKSGTLDASQITVTNLDAHSITTGSLSAVVNDLRKFETFVLSPSNQWDFNYTKSSYGNWFLIGETNNDHVYNGPGITPYMYVTSRGPKDGDRFTVTVWKDNDPTQYQRVWNGWSWSDWVMLPNSQNLVSAINLSPDGVKISGKNIELDGNTAVTGQLDLMQKNTNYVNQNSNYHNPWSWNNAHIYFNNYLQLLGENCDVTYEDNSHLNGGKKFYSIGTLTPGYLKFTAYQNKVNSTDEKFDGQIARTYIDSSRIETNDAWAGNLRIVGHHIRAADDKFVMVSNHAGTNFDNNGSVGFQVYGGIGLGRSKIYTPDLDLYIQRGNAVTALGQSYNDAGKVDVHCNRVISQVANTISSRLSVKTDITPVSYDRALAAVEGTEMYDYRYISDDSGQHYVSGIIDDINPEDPQYHMDDMLINKERTARIDANLVGYHHVILQELIKKIDELETRLESKEK